MSKYEIVYKAENEYYHGWFERVSIKQFDSEQEAIEYIHTKILPIFKVREAKNDE